jgi:hypothetical protein
MERGRLARKTLPPSKGASVFYHPQGHPIACSLAVFLIFNRFLAKTMDGFKHV